jgi:hypothetical protein
MEIKKVLKLPYAEFQQAEYVRHIWLATPEAGTKPEDLVKPEYWTHVLKKLQKGDFIEVTAAEGDWLAKLYIRAVTTAGVVVHMFPVEYIGKPAAKISDDYLVQLAGKHKWRVIRNSDKVEMVKLLDTREIAEAWLIDYLKR